MRCRSQRTIYVSGSGVLTLDVLHLVTEDRDPDQDGLNIIAVTNGAFGTTLTDGSIITYTPRAGYDGNDSFSCTISDGRGGSDTATVRLLNALPIVAADLVVTNGEPVTLDPRLNDADATMIRFSLPRSHKEETARW